MKFASLQFGSMMILHCTYLVPRRLSLDENVRAKEGGKETTTVCTLLMVPCGSPPVARFYLACSRLSDSGEDAKLKGTRNVGGPFFFSCSRFQRARLSRSLQQASLYLAKNDSDAPEEEAGIVRNTRKEAWACLPRHLQSNIEIYLLTVPSEDIFCSRRNVKFKDTFFQQSTIFFCLSS